MVPGTPRSERIRRHGNGYAAPSGPNLIMRAEAAATGFTSSGAGGGHVQVQQRRQREADTPLEMDIFAEDAHTVSPVMTPGRARDAHGTAPGAMTPAPFGHASPVPDVSGGGTTRRVSALTPRPVPVSTGGEDAMMPPPTTSGPHVILHVSQPGPALSAAAAASEAATHAVQVATSSAAPTSPALTVSAAPVAATDTRAPAMGASLMSPYRPGVTTAVLVDTARGPIQEVQRGMDQRDGGEPEEDELQDWLLGDQPPLRHVALSPPPPRRTESMQAAPSGAHVRGHGTHIADDG